MARFYPTCEGGQFTLDPGAPVCAVDWVWVEVTPDVPYWTLDFPGAVALLSAAALLWALAWGLRVIVRNVFKVS